MGLRRGLVATHGLRQKSGEVLPRLSHQFAHGRLEAGELLGPARECCFRIGDGGIERGGIGKAFRAPQGHGRKILRIKIRALCYEPRAYESKIGLRRADEFLVRGPQVPECELGLGTCGLDLLKCCRARRRWLRSVR